MPGVDSAAGDLAALCSPCVPPHEGGHDFANATTGVKRALRRFPALAPFERSARHPAGLDLVHLANLDARFREHAAGLPAAGLDVASLADLANGIPRSFPIHNAVFYFPDVPWADVRGNDPVVAPGSWYAGPPLPASPVPGILLTSHWWSTRRKIELHATVPLATPAPDARELPCATEPVRRNLRELGSFRAPELRVVLERGEGLTPADSKHLEDIVRSWDAAIATLLDVLPLPHALPPPTPWMSSGLGPTSPYKAPLVSTFRPRGWRYRSSESSAGYLAIGKQSLRGNKLRAYFGRRFHVAQLRLVRRARRARLARRVSDRIRRRAVRAERGGRTFPAVPNRRRRHMGANRREHRRGHRAPRANEHRRSGGPLAAGSGVVCGHGLSESGLEPSYRTSETYRAGPSRTRPGVGRIRPEVGRTRPAVGRIRPGVGRTRPGVGRIRPGVGRTRPGVGRTRPGVGRTRPGVGRIRPGVGRTRPGVDRSRPGIDSSRRAVGRVPSSVPPYDS